MSVDSLRSAGYINHPQPSDNSFGSGFGTSDLSGKTNTSGQSGGGINYGVAQSGGSVLNFGNTLSQSHAAVGDAGSGSNTQNSGGELNQQILQVMSELLKMVMQLLQQNSGNSNNDSSSSSATSSGSSGNGSPAADVGAATASNVAQPQVNAGATIPAQSASSPAIDSSGADNLSSSAASTDPDSAARATPASGKPVGSGPRSSNIVSEDSAGDKTIAGWYDGSSDTMKAGGQYMEDQLGTGDTYIHPNDDRLGQGSNPMRHTDAMNIDVSFGKA